MNWCWHCFVDGMNFYGDNSNWILDYPQIATDSYNWITYLDSTKDFTYSKDIMTIKIPPKVEWDDLMINGFKFLIEDFVNTKIDIRNYFVKDGYLIIHFDLK